MQKFEKSDEPLSERRNIVVMADEAHRGQYGLKEKVDAETGKIKIGTARVIRNSLPNAIRARMGKPIFFTLTHCSKKLSGVSNKYNYKANMHKLCYVGARFYNVKYQASIMTNCNFRNANFIGIDFFNCNLRGTSFKNTSFKNVVFYNCNLRDADFKDAIFENVVFICTNFKEVKNLDFDNPEINILKTYNRIDLNSAVESRLLALAQNDLIFDARVLHVNKNKLNHWVLSLLNAKYGDKAILFLSKLLPKKEKWNNMYTIYSYMQLIENLMKA